MSNQHLKVYGYIITNPRKIGEAYDLKLSHKSWLIRLERSFITMHLRMTLAVGWTINLSSTTQLYSSMGNIL